MASSGSAGGAGSLATLSALRAPVPGLAPLADPGPAAAREDLLFRERAFWLFATGHRLGDLRRLVRQYGRDASAVFPVGSFIKGGTFGDDVNFPVSQAERNNPEFHGCLNRDAWRDGLHDQNDHHQHHAAAPDLSRRRRGGVPAHASSRPLARRRTRHDCGAPRVSHFDP